MSERFHQNPAKRNMLPRMDDEELDKTITEVLLLDPELLEQPDTRQLVELGAQAGKQVTEQYGTPDMPRWASGTREKNVIMSYHNGGFDGHTSVGPYGAGVPRNALIIAKKVNQAAGKEVYDPLVRAIAFYASEKHDDRQLCGRSLLPEGQGEDCGDERLSAEAARDEYLAVGGDPEVANEIYTDIMATAFNPRTSTQNVNYEAWLTNPNDPALIRMILGQELTAAADLLGPTSRRGPLGAFEYSIELMCLEQKDTLVQRSLRAHGVELASMENMEQMLIQISEDAELAAALANTYAEQARFFSDHLKYSDKVIRTVCGQGIDELFPGRLENAALITRYAEKLGQGQHTLAIWNQLRALAGYAQ